MDPVLQNAALWTQDTIRTCTKSKLRRCQMFASLQNKIDMSPVAEVLEYTYQSSIIVLPTENKHLPTSALG